jgi:hypothetical protein
MSGGVVVWLQETSVEDALRAQVVHLFDINPCQII